MQYYELLYIIPMSVPEEGIPEVEQSVDHIITEVSGKVHSHDQIGKRKLAFPIKLARYGTYVNILFEAEAQALGEVQRRLRLHQNVLRFLITEYDMELSQLQAKHQQSRQAYKARLAQTQASQTVPVLTPTHTAPSVPSRQATPAQSSAAQQQTQAPQAPVNLEELSKKLDKILDDDMLK